MEKGIPQINANETATIVIVFICVTTFAIIKYCIPKIKRYYHHVSYINAPISNEIKYNSLIDSKDLFFYNYNLNDITVHTKKLNISYPRCIRQCSKQKKLKLLSVATDDEVCGQINDLKIDPFTNLTFLHLTIDSANHTNTDYLLPIIQNSKNLESIAYEKGHLSSLSMKILIDLQKLNFLLLDNIYVIDSKAFSIMLFNLNTQIIFIASSTRFYILSYFILFLFFIF